MFLTDLPDIISDAGLTVVCVEGWETRANNSGGFDGWPVGIVEHHTAGSASGTLEGELSVLVHGNSAAPGPIAQLLIWRDGYVYVVAAGRCNHAGSGGPWRGITSMNKSAIGIEQANNGVGEEWSSAMIDTSETLSAALIAAYAIPMPNVVSHMEWAPDRKIDPAGPWQLPPHAGMTEWTPENMAGWRSWLDILVSAGGGEQNDDVPYLVRDVESPGDVYERLPGGKYVRVTNFDFYDGMAMEIDDVPTRDLTQLRADGAVEA